MRKLTIKNVGPIKNVEFEINRINVFMGPQSSGKSTISKILCHCQWVEKSCFMNDKELENFQKDGVFLDSLVEYHKLYGYFNKNASIKYVGDYLTITYTHSSRKTTIKVKGGVEYAYPKICYIPSERNFVAGVSNFSKYNEGNNVILFFGYDWADAKVAICKLDISKLLNREVIYENINDRDYIFDHGSKLALVNASSGVQSVLPLYQTILYMLGPLYQQSRVLSPIKENAKRELNKFLNVAMMMPDALKNDGGQYKEDKGRLITVFRSLKSHGVIPAKSLTKLTKMELVRNVQESLLGLDALFDYRYTQLFVEEPEQNLFPDTQQEFVYWLLNGMQDENRKHSAVITTHSPYILFALNNCMMGGLVKHSIPEEEQMSFPSSHAWINPKDVSVFEIMEDGLRRIQDEDGIIEDNYLNKAYKKNSQEYLSLLNYYEDEE